MKRNEAIELLHQYIASPNLRKHSYASEVVMHALALRLGADPEKWALAGLLHDLDVELVNADPGNTATKLYVSSPKRALILKSPKPFCCITNMLPAG